MELWLIACSSFLPWLTSSSPNALFGCAYLMDIGILNALFGCTYLIDKRIPLNLKFRHIGLDPNYVNSLLQSPDRNGSFFSLGLLLKDPSCVMLHNLHPLLISYLQMEAPSYKTFFFSSFSSIVYKFVPNYAILPT